jgi:hypothetical protein
MSLAGRPSKLGPILGLSARREENYQPNSDLEKAFQHNHMQPVSAKPLPDSRLAVSELALNG